MLGSSSEFEHVDRLLEAVGLGERVGVFGELGVRKDAAVPLEASMTLAIPHLAGLAGGEVVLVHRACSRVRLCAAACATSPAACATSPAAASASPASPAGGERRRAGERKAEDENAARNGSRELSARPQKRPKGTAHR